MEGLEMVKTFACVAFAAWMALCVMMIVYYREVAELIFERL
jgi:hypothetical protein